MNSKVLECNREGRLVFLSICALGVSSVMTQLALMREMLCAFSGNEMVLGVILGNWLLLTGLGAWLGRASARLKHPIRVLLVAQMLVAVLPPAQVGLARVLRDIVFIRGAAIGVAETVVSSFVLLAPFCLVSGFMLTLACAVLAEREGAGGVGRVYVADSVGSIVGGVAFTFVLIRWFDHFALLIFSAVVNLAVACALALCFRRRLLLAAAAVALAAVGLVVVLVDVDEATTALQYPQQRVVFRGNSPYGKLVVTQTAGQFNFIENGVPFISTHNVEQIEETVHYAMAQRPDARRVLLVSGGVSGTAREILKYGVAEVTYVELDPLVIEAGRRYLPDALADPRIKVVNTDGRLFIRRAGRSRAYSEAGMGGNEGATDRFYDVVIVDMPDPSTSQINRFFTAEFFREVKRVLAPQGVLSFALGRYENYVSKELAQMLASAHSTLRQSFRHVLVIPGGRVFFVGSDGELFADIAARIEQAGVPTQLVNRNYLAGMLTPNRLADMQRAVAQAAEVNRDFSPVLYFYHLKHWMSQFEIRFGLLEAALLVALAVYLVVIRPVQLVVFVSGFAASALSVVLLLGFQILYGSVYRQVGVIVTVFMAGLAVGAWLVNRPVFSGDSSSRRRLAVLAFAVAVFAVVLPLPLQGLGRVGATAPALVFVHATIALLAFVLAALVGMEFPVATKAQFAGGAVTASRLYTADFIGACLGALLASTFLIPLLGVTAVCLLTAGLNVIGGASVLLRKG